MTSSSGFTIARILSALLLASFLTACSPSRPDRIYGGLTVSVYTELHVYPDGTAKYYHQIEGDVSVEKGIFRESRDRASLEFSDYPLTMKFRRFLHRGLEYLVDESMMNELLQMDESQRSELLGEAGQFHFATVSRFVDEQARRRSQGLVVADNVAMSDAGVVNYSRTDFPPVEVGVNATDKETARIAFETYIALHPHLRPFRNIDFQIEELRGAEFTFWCSIQGPDARLLLFMVFETPVVTAATIEIKPDAPSAAQ